MVTDTKFPSNHPSRKARPPKSNTGSPPKHSLKHAPRVTHSRSTPGHVDNHPAGLVNALRAPRTAMGAVDTHIEELACTSRLASARCRGRASARMT